LGIKFNDNEDLYASFSTKDSFIDSENYLVLEYPDHFSIDGSKKVRVKYLGEKFAAINSFFFDYLKEYHVPAAFVKNHNKNSLKFLKYERFKFHIKILNIVDKRIADLFGLQEKELLDLPVFEIHYGNGNDSLISESYLMAFDLCTPEELKIMNRICSKVNAVLKSFFERRNSILAETICHFGKHKNKIFLIDDFTPKSLKILPLNKEDKWIDPYKLETSAGIKQYTDHLLNLMSA